jgi:hypothetical protein
VGKDKPSPFATELGQAVLSALEDPLVLAGALRSAPATPPAAAAPARSSKGAGGAPLLAGLQQPLPRARPILGAMTLPPPTLAQPSLAAQQQRQQHGSEREQQQQQGAQHGGGGGGGAPSCEAPLPGMRKLTSVPASNLPCPRHITTPTGPHGLQHHPLCTRAAVQQRQQPAHVVTAAPAPAAAAAAPTAAAPTAAAPGGLQSWSSLPSAGLRTCSSLQQLHLKLSGAPPSPADLLDLSRLVHLTHLSLKQVRCAASLLARLALAQGVRCGVCARHRRAL